MIFRKSHFQSMVFYFIDKVIPFLELSRTVQLSFAKGIKKLKELIWYNLVITILAKPISL